MSIAHAIIGKKAQTTESAEQPQVIERPLTPEELIDAVAESEFPIDEAGVTHDRTGVGSPGDGAAPKSAMKDGKSGKTPGPGISTVSAKSKKTKGEVAATPKSGDPVKYGKK